MTTTNETKAIHLQGVGRFQAKPVSEVAVGDRLVWNYGYTSEVVSIERVSPAFVAVTTRGEEGLDGRLYTRRMKLSRLVAFSTRKGA
jgi:hypothetical protein